MCVKRQEQVIKAQIWGHICGLFLRLTSSEHHPRQNIWLLHFLGKNIYCLEWWGKLSFAEDLQLIWVEIITQEIYYLFSHCI